MKDILALIPKNILAFLAIALGVLVIVFAQPPHSVCDSQIEVVNDQERTFLFKDPKSKKITRTRYEALRDRCKQTNDPGGCYELFQELKIMLKDLNTLPESCNSTIADTTEYTRALKESNEMLVRLAWGEAPPGSYANKFGWLDVADITLYCRIKDKYVSVFGQSSFDNFREKMMHDLPGAESMPRNQVWDLSLFSESCGRYP